MHKPLLSVYFVVRAFVEQPDGKRRFWDEQIHRVCTRDEITQRDYLEYVAWALYNQFKRTANRVLSLVVMEAWAPGNERIALNETVLPGDIDPEWRAA